jgi:hypothetical protein
MVGEVMMFSIIWRCYILAQNHGHINRALVPTKICHVAELAASICVRYVEGKSEDLHI